jgi:hypothetical protein
MNRRLSTATRHLVLGTAFAAALAAWLVPHPSAVRAATSAAENARIAEVEPKAPVKAPAAKDSAKATAKDAAKTAEAPSPGAGKAASDADKDEAKDEAPGTDITIDPRGIRVDKGKKRVHVQGFGSDHEYDSFESFVQDAPWLAGLVFMTVLLVFLVPLLIIVLLIWYKVRKTRMLNETMLKLAEKGVVPPAEAMASLNANQVSAGPATTPLYEQAKQMRHRAASSDLRKSVILVAIGLGLSFFSMLDDGTPNSIGLILLFLGIGYGVLWFFEDRIPAPKVGGTVPPPGGA